MSLLPFFQWCESTTIGEAIRASTWLFPVIEAFHLIALALLSPSKDLFHVPALQITIANVIPHSE